MLILISMMKFLPGSLVGHTGQEGGGGQVVVIGGGTVGQAITGSVEKIGKNC